MWGATASPCCFLLSSKDIGSFFQWISARQSWVKCIKANLAKKHSVSTGNGVVAQTLFW